MEEKLKNYYRAYDRIKFLAIRLEEVRKKLMSDDWALKYFMNTV